jgi:AmmeMemoRadiSam system protein A
MDDEVHPLVKLAQRAVATYVLERRRVDALPEDELAPELRTRAGTFVSLHKFGELRGCIGTFTPLRANVAEEVIDNAIASATRDPRFPPVQAAELADLDISVDVLDEPEPVESETELDPEIFGVIVADLSGARRGLLLPALEQVKSARQQVAIARQKAYIAPNEPVQLYRFRVKRYH